MRTSDRVEAAVSLLFTLLAVLAMPIAAAAGTAIHENLVTEFTQERLLRQLVDATVPADSREMPELQSKP